MIKKIRFLLLVVLFLLSFSPIVLAEKVKPLEVPLPAFPPVMTSPPSSVLTYLPNYIRYIYISIVVSGGLIAFLAILIGGLYYLTSAGNPSQMSDAKNRIISGVIGLIIILSSYVILQEINPQLLGLSPPKLYATGSGIILYHSSHDCQKAQDFPLAAGFKENKDFIRVGLARSFPSFDVGSFYSFNSRQGNPAITEIDFYQNKDCSGIPAARVPNRNLRLNTSRHCYPLTLPNVQCVKIKWYIPGVWLFSYKDGDPLNPEADKVIEIFQTSQPYLPENLQNTGVKSIAFVPNKEKKFTYGAILYQNTGGLGQLSGWAHPYVPDNLNEIAKFNIDKPAYQKAKALTVFIPDPNAPNKTVTICRDELENNVCAQAPVPNKKDKNGKPILKPVSIYYHWGSSPSSSSLTNASTTDEYLSAIQNARPGLKNSDIIREGFWGEEKRWGTGEQIAVCNPHLPIYDFIDRISQYVAKCQRGVSGIKVEEGGSYLIVLFSAKAGKGKNIPLDDPRYHPLVISGTEPSLGQRGYNDAAGAMYVIKIKTSL